MKPTTLSFVAAAVLASAACSDKEGYEPLSPTGSSRVGNEVAFALCEPATSRTHYDNRLSVRWDENDQIRIYSPDVNKEYTTAQGESAPPVRSDTQHGTYTVKVPAADDDESHNEISSADEGDKLYWSDGTAKGYWDGTAGSAEGGWHRFFAAYPDERVTAMPSLSGPKEKALFKMRYITNQVNRIDDDEAVNLGGTLLYQGRPDMKNCYMMAMRDVRIDDDHILLDFDPIMTTLDIRVTAAGFNVPIGVVAGHRITGVSVIMGKGMANGEIEYDLTEGTAHQEGDRTINGESEHEGAGRLADGSVDDFSESVFVGIEHNGKNYIDLSENESLLLTAFLPPVPQAYTKGYKIKVHTAGAYDYTKTLYKSDGTPNSPSGGEGWGLSAEGLMQQSRVEVTLPKVNPFDTGMCNNWMAKLHPGTPIAHLCIPGDRATVWAQEKDEKTKETTLNLLKKGVRAFDLRETDGDNLQYIFPALLQFLDENPSEFIVVFDNRSTAGGRLFDFRSHLKDSKEERSYLWDFSKKEALTIEKVKGHIVYVCASNDALHWWYVCYRQAAISKKYNNWSYNSADDYVEKDEDIQGSDGTTCTNLSFAPKEVLRFSPLEVGKNQSWLQFLYNDENADRQTGCTGVVMMPHAGEREHYGEQLLQALIDCNFKLHRSTN